jgi:hypothetical protein
MPAMVVPPLPSDRERSMTPTPSPTPSPLTAESFEPHLGTDFAVPSTADDATPVVLRLVEVERYPTQPHAPRPDPFSLLFTSDAVLDQRIHRLDHEAIGSLEIFLVPIGPGADGRLRYEAVFN